MIFEELNNYVPHAIGKSLHVMSMEPYDGVILQMPGRHQSDTPKKGGDFVVLVTDTTAGWKKRQFKHDCIFIDFENKRNSNEVLTSDLLNDYMSVVVDGFDPESFNYGGMPLPGVEPERLLCAMQCLAVAEHRRYAKFEPRGGGRYLPLRFTAGIVEGKWTAAQAVSMQKRGRPGVEQLESQYGIPNSTQLLLDSLKAAV